MFEPLTQGSGSATDSMYLFHDIFKNFTAAKSTDY